MEKRQSNFELLRILCMLLIIGIHITTQTAMDGIKINDGINYYYVTLIGSAGRLVCNTFVIIGAWFLVDSDFKPERVVSLWLEIFLYAVPITIACLFVGCENASLTTLIQAFFPVFGRPVWFGAEYICLLLLTPWLNIMLKDKNIYKTKKIVLLFGILIIGCATIFPIEHTTPAFSELIWFCFLYLLTGLYKHKQLLINDWFEKHSFLCFCICYLLLCGVKFFSDCMEISYFRQIFVYYREHYEALPGFICSVFLFLTFKNINVKYCSAVNLISRSTFAVYIIHQTPAFYRFLWNGIFHVDEAVKNDNVILYSLIVIVTIFIVCVVIDQLRILFMKKVICLSKIYRITCEKIAKFYKE